MKEEMEILIVDDDRQMSKTICDILGVKGYKVVQAYTGEEAVSRIQSENPDCVLMDIKMPGMDGVEALRTIKKISPDLPVVLMSAFATEVQLAEAQKLGAYTVLDKPIDIQMILSFLSCLQRDKSILVVDDDPLFSKMLKDVLQSRGYRVETEADPQKVLDHMEEDYKLAVVLDLKLGNADGMDVLKNIRGKYPTKPVLLASSHQENISDSMKQALQKGAYACLYKTIETEALISTLQEIRRKKLSAVLGTPFEMPHKIVETSSGPD